MRNKLLAFILLILPVIMTGCGGDEGAASGEWVGEVFASSNSKSATVIGEFDSYDACVEATQKESKSGIFNCGIK